MTFPRTAAAIALLMLAVPLAAAEHVSGADFAAIHAVLDAQAKSWNRGDLRGYMNGYLRDANTTFVSGDTVTHGWQTVFDRYAKKYDSREKMGTLVFSDVDLRPFTGDDVLVTGAWELTRQSDKPHGCFTLLFRRTAVGWRIVYDHSS